NPQLEGNIDQLLLQGAALPAQDYLPVTVDKLGLLQLGAGELQGMTAGSRFALYPAGTKDFKTTQPIAEAEIEQLQLVSAQLSLRPEFLGRVKPDELQNARAVERVRKYGDSALLLAIAPGVEQMPNAGELVKQLAALPLVNPTLKETER